ncbi:hypothetical protein GUT184_16590 [Streptococcus ruminantium]|nr:hypothetical protein GUT184_16590 [Streptococcus ruminantium]BDD43368.1 hypothetical protein GUT189_17010 [Streptococcus ruminantium]
MRGAKIVTFVPLNKLFLKPNQISWIRQRENNNVKIGFGEGTILAVELSCFLATNVSGYKLYLRGGNPMYFMA